MSADICGIIEKNITSLIFFLPPKCGDLDLKKLERIVARIGLNLSEY